jgi:23S rRNA (uracil1939-C5)-methyltransferase
MTFGRSAIARVDGKTVMVPAAVPGDLLEIEIASEKRDYAIGRIVRVIRAAPERREPPCRYAARCGGCDWQQIRYDAQVQLKAELIAAEFQRALGVELDPCGLVEPAPAEFGYRSRVRLKTGPGGEVGFYQHASKVLVRVEECLVAAPAISAAERLARALGRRCSEIEVVTSSRGEVLVAELTKPPARFEYEVAQRMAGSDVAGVILRSATTRDLLGDARVAIEAEPGCVVEADADLFSQVNRAQNLKLVAAVMELAQISPATRVLDIFCGAGNLSLPAARRGGQVTGIDANALAIEAARENAARMGLREAQFLAMRALEGVGFLARAGNRPRVVIMDPPRAGAADLIEPLTRLRAERLVYVSCDPSTMVRDLLALVRKGYKLTQARGFDFFPNTHHVEIVASLLLT